MSTILITGGAGFIGSHVAERFLAEGHRVAIVDNLSTGRRENVPADAVFHELDIAAPECGALISQGDFSVVVHLAAQIDVRKSVADPAADAATNILGSLQLFEAARRVDPAKRPRIVFVSTGGAIYGDAPLPTPETFAPNPEAPYGIAKLCVEHYLAYYGRTWKMDTVTVRLANVYGPRQNPEGEAGVVAIFSNRLRLGKPMTIFGDGSQTRDYVYVADVADAVYRAATAELPTFDGVDSRAFNVSTGIGTSVLDLATAMAKAAGVTANIEHAASRPGELQASTPDFAKIQRTLGWEPQVDLGEGLRRTLQWAGVID